MKHDDTTILVQSMTNDNDFTIVMEELTSLRAEVCQIKEWCFRRDERNLAVNQQKVTAVSIPTTPSYFNVRWKSFSLKMKKAFGKNISNDSKKKRRVWLQPLVYSCITEMQICVVCRLVNLTTNAIIWNNIFQLKRQSQRRKKPKTAPGLQELKKLTNTDLEAALKSMMSSLVVRRPTTNVKIR